MIGISMRKKYITTTCYSCGREAFDWYRERTPLCDNCNRDHDGLVLGMGMGKSKRVIGRVSHLRRDGHWYTIHPIGHVYKQKGTLKDLNQ